MTQRNLFIAFFRSGLLGYGGGPSAIPLIHKETVELYKWMDDEEFGNLLAIANTLPGPIATKMAGAIGYRVGGILGLLNALLAAVMPTVILMILFLTVLRQWSEITWVQGLTYGVIPVVSVMLFQMTWTFVKQGMKWLGVVMTIIHIIIAIILLEVLNIHPALLIFVLLGWALFSPSKKKEEGEEE